MPYGEKTKKELLSYADKILKFFKSKDAKAVIMACNTTSSMIYDDIKEKYGLKIYPIIQTVAKDLAKYEKIAVFATPATVNSDAYQNEIHKYNKNSHIVQIACPKWVKIVEENKVNSRETLDFICEKFDELNGFEPDKIILGCTHYPYLLNVLSNFAPREIFIDPAEIFAKSIMNDLKSTNDKSGFEEFYVSSNPEKFQLSSYTYFLKLFK